MGEDPHRGASQLGRLGQWQKPLQTIVARSRPRVQMDRRAVLGGACAALLGAACASAQGSDVRVARAGLGPAPRVGHAWTLKLTVRPATFNGAVRVTADGPVRLSVRAAGRHGTYRARLVFPKTGVWRLVVRAGGTRTRLGQVRALARAPLVLEEPTGIAVRPDGSLLVV